MRAQRAAFERRAWGKLDSQFPGRRAVRAEAEAAASQEADRLTWVAYCAARAASRRAQRLAGSESCDGRTREEDSTGGQVCGSLGQMGIYVSAGHFEPTQAARGNDDDQLPSGGRGVQKGKGAQGKGESEGRSRVPVSEETEETEGGRRSWWSGFAEGVGSLRGSLLDGARLMGAGLRDGLSRGVRLLGAVRGARAAQVNSTARVVVGGRERSGALWRRGAGASASVGGVGAGWQAFSSLSVRMWRELRDRRVVAQMGALEGTHYGLGRCLPM